MTALVGAVPEVSVVISARNAAGTIGKQLDALANQTFGGTWETVIVDDRSTDTTAEVSARWSGVLPGLTILSPVSWHGLSHARNVGTAVARGCLIAYCDADDVVSPDWLAGLTSALETHELATGPVDLSLLNPPETYRWRTESGWERLPDWHGFLPAALGCNLAVRREVFEQLGGFDVAAGFGDDFDFVWRAQVGGAKLAFAPIATVHYRLRPRPLSFFVSHVRYGRSEARHFARFSSAGMPRRLGAGLLRVALVLPTSPMLLFRNQRYRWLAGAGIAVGRIAGSYHNRVLYL